MAKVLISDQYLTNIGNAIREKNGLSTTYTPAEMAPAIRAIETVPALQTKSITPTTAEQVVNPDSGYDGFSSVTISAMPTASQAVPQISINTETGLITATANQLAGYVGAGTERGTLQLTTKGETTITPSSTDQTIAAGQYLIGTQTIRGDANLISSNIVSGVSIFGVAGSASQGAANPTLQNKQVTPSAAIQTITADSGYDGLGTVTITGDEDLIPANIKKNVNIFGVIGTSEEGDISILQSKSIVPTTQQQVITPDAGYTGLSSVTIGAVSTTSINISANGTYNASNGNFYSTVVVDIEDGAVNLQSKSVTPSNVPQSVVPDSGYHGLSSVSVDAIPSNYANVSGITITSNDVLSGVTFVDANGIPKTGLLQTSSYYVGSGTPSSSLGEDGDLYLKV